MSRAIEFTKGHGTGNDFVLFSDPGGEIELSENQYALLADRHFGIGGDGVIRAVRSQNIPEGKALIAAEPDAEWFMDYRNADGSLAEMCGNGIRVFVSYLIQQGFISDGKGARFAIATRAGVKDVQVGGNGNYRVDLGRWRVGDGEVAPGQDTTLTPFGRASIDATGIWIGNPHAVSFVDSDEELAELELSAAPIIAPGFAPGQNSEFVAPFEPVVDDGIGRIRMRVFERGVGETLSCGTGAAAAALATRHKLGAGAPNNWRVEVPGGSLGVQMFPTEEGEHVSLSGPAELLYSGVLTV